MPTQLLSLGPVQALTQNVVYALPASRCLIFATGTPTFEQSNDVAFGTVKAVTLDTNNQAEVAGGFIRLTSAGPVNVTLKKR